MSEDMVGYQVGRGRLPRHTQWKKGQSGNPRRSPWRIVETAAEMMDRLLVVPVHVTVNSETRRAPTLEAIMLALSQKAFAGNISAKRTLVKYSGFAKTHSDKKLQLTFVDSDYTRAVAQRSGGDNE
jgi:hypothetical protein